MNFYVLNYNGYMIKEAKESIEFPLYLSDKLEKVLQIIKTDPIAKKLLDEQYNRELREIANVLSDISFLDIDKDSKSVSFFPIDRLNKIQEEVLPGKRPSSNHEVWTSRLRQSMSWGKVINKLFPDKFTNMDIDRFYNRYRPEIDVSDKQKSRFEVVHGEDIRYWYLNSHWDGSFGSCMQTIDKQAYFDIYCNNPDKCGLLIYKSEQKPDKIIARALVWNNLLKPSGDTQADKNPYTLLDRVYYVSSASEAAFQKYAIDHNWIYKSGQIFMMNGERKTASVSTRLKPVDYTYYPYVDTMCYYTPDTGRAASTPGNPGRDPNDPKKIFKRYLLQSQTGGKQIIG